MFAMSALGRLLPFDLLDFKKFEGPLLMKAVIQNLAPETPLANDRLPLESGRMDYTFDDRHKFVSPDE